MKLRLLQFVTLCRWASSALLVNHAHEKCSCNDCQAVMRRHEEQSGFVQTGSIEEIDQKLICERSDGNLTHQCSNFCSRDCRATLPKKFSSHIQCEQNPGTPRSAKGISLSQLSVAYKIMSGCPEPLPCLCSCDCPPITYGTPLPPPPLPPFATLSPPELSVGLLQAPTGVPAEVTRMYTDDHGITPQQRALARQGVIAEIQMAPQPPPPSSPGASFTQVEEHTQRVAVDGFPNVVLGPPPPPPPPIPPPVARGACPKSAGCNCYCPCRDEPQR